MRLKSKAAAIRAHTQLCDWRRNFASSTLAAAACKITTKGKIPLHTSKAEIVERLQQPTATNRQHGRLRLSGDSSDSQVHPQPSARSQADGRVSFTPSPSSFRRSSSNPSRCPPSLIFEFDRRRCDSFSCQISRLKLMEGNGRWRNWTAGLGLSELLMVQNKAKAVCVLIVVLQGHPPPQPRQHLQG